MAEKRPSRKTRVGYMIPHLADTDAPGATDHDASHPGSPAAEHAREAMAPAPPRAEPPRAEPPRAEPPRAAAPPAIEIEYIHETDVSGTWNVPWPMLQIWTRNRIYCIDDGMTCVEVINRETGHADPTHTLLGTRLTGGQRRSRTSNAVEIVCPFPVPGMEAVFKRDNRRHGQYGQTSTVERVVLRMRRIRVGATSAEPAWDGLTGRFQTR